MPASFRNEWPTWVLAFVIALGLWTWINLSARPDVQSRTVPLVLEESDVLEVAPASQLPGQVEVRVEGNEDDVREYMESLKRAWINLTEANEGKGQRFKIRVPDPPFGSVKVTVDPGEWILDLAPATTRNMVPVKREEGQLKPDYYLDEPSGLPTSVEVRGPIEQVRQVAKVEYPLQLSGLDESTTRTVRFIPVDAAGNTVPHVRVTPPEAEVTFTLRIQTSNRIVPVVPDLEGHAAPGYIVTGFTADPDFVEITSQSKAIGAIKNLKTAKVSIEGITSSVTFDKVEVPSPNPLVRVNPRTVRVIVTVERWVPEVRFQGIPVALNRQQPGLTYTLKPAAVDLVVRGNTADLKAAFLDQFQVRLDVSGYGPGTHSIDPAGFEILAPTELTITGQSPAEFTLEVTGTPAAP